MEATAYWTAWVDGHNEVAARRTMARIFKRFGSSPPEALVMEPYHKGGFRIAWSQSHSGATWGDVVVAAIAYGQRAATPWMLSGDVGEECSGLASKTGQSKISIPGVTMLTWELSRHGTP